MKGNGKLLTVLNLLLADELIAVNAYNGTIKIAREVDDQSSVDLLARILKMEEGRLAEIQNA
jgi:bacterioferritin (cytochrome b1)